MTEASATAEVPTALPPRAERAAPSWAPWAVRAAGAWILLGGVLKAFLGSPRNLPALVQSLPLPIAFVFGAVLAMEGFVGTFALLRPARGWPLAGALLLGFAGLLVQMIASGAASCGCFGGTITVPPVAALGIDVALLAALVAARPWRLRGVGHRGDLVALGVALLVAVALPLIAKRGDDPLRAFVGTGDVAKWKSMRLDETPVPKWLPKQPMRDGVWLFWRESCELCAECLRRMAATAGTREITLVQLPETSPDAHAVVHEFPKGPWVHHVRLGKDMPFEATPPVRLIVEGGVIVEVTSITDANEQCP